MNRSEHILLKIFRETFLPKYLLLLPILFLINSSCIKTDTSDCVRFSLNVKVLNTNGEDITALGEAGDVQLYIFDGDLHYLDQVNVSSEDIINAKRLDFFYRTNSQSVWVVAWSNLKRNQSIIPPSFSRGTNMEDALIQLKRDADEYAINPDDLFYGVINVRGQQSNQQIPIRRKTALLRVTINGVNFETGKNYYLVIEGAKQDAYNFKGNLVGNPIHYKHTEGFKPSETSYNTLIPFRVFPVSEGNSLIIYVYKELDIIAFTDRDTEGKPIVPIVGVTNNILINLPSGETSIDVTVKVTDWNDFYQWSIW